MRLIFTSFCLFIASMLQGQILVIDFDKPTSGSLVDKSSSKHKVNMYGDLEYVPDRFGNDCRAARFHGDQFLEIVHDDAFNVTREFTAMSWLLLPEYPDFQWITLICKGLNPQEGEDSPAFRVQVTSGTVSVNTSSTKEIDEVRQSYPREKWFHFATSYKDGKINIYVDGRLYKSFDTYTQLVNNNHSVTIGYDIPGHEEYFSGVMDDLYFFDYAMNDKKIQSFANSQKNKNLGNACPVINNPPNQPVASTGTPVVNDPWDDLEIEEIDDSPISTVKVNDPRRTPGKTDPWADISIEIVEEPTKSADNDPVLTPAHNDPWDEVGIDELVETPDPGDDQVVDSPVDTVPTLKEPVDDFSNDDPVPGQPVDSRPFVDLTNKTPDSIVQLNSPPLRSVVIDEDPVEERDAIPITMVPGRTVGLIPNLSVTPIRQVDIDSTFVENETPVTNGEEDDPTVDLPPVQEVPAITTDSLTADEPLLSEPELVDDLDSLDVGKKMILDRIEFARHSAHLNDRSKAVLKELAEVLKKNPEFSILLEGHTELDGAREANLDLSRRRAEACERYLIKRRKIKARRIETKFHGPDKPLTTEKQILWKNRRVEVTVY